MSFECIPFDFETAGLSMKWDVLTVNPLQTHIKMSAAFYVGFFLCVYVCVQNYTQQQLK